MSSLQTVFGDLTVVCILSALLECLVGREDSSAPMYLLCGLVIAAECMMMVQELIYGLTG